MASDGPGGGGWAKSTLVGSYVCNAPISAISYRARSRTVKAACRLDAGAGGCRVEKVQ